MELLTLHGTFPMVFRGVAYHTPVQVSSVDVHGFSLARPCVVSAEIMA